MPNHTANNFTVTGPLADIHRFLNAVKTAESQLDFNGIVSMPDELRGTSSPVRIQTQEEIDKIWADWNSKKDAGLLKDHELREGRPWGLGITQEKHDELISKYGCSDWYGIS